MSCEDKFGETRSVTDPRLKITLADDGGLLWKTQDMNFVTARECAARLGMFVRMTDMFSGTFPEAIVDSVAGRMIEFERFGDEEKQTICMAHHPGSGAIQAAINGMTLFQATILCESFVFEMNKAMMGETMNGATI